MKAKLYSVSVDFIDLDVALKIGRPPWIVWWAREGLGNIRDIQHASKVSLARLARVISSRKGGRFMSTPWGWCYYL